MAWTAYAGPWETRARQRFEKGHMGEQKKAPSDQDRIAKLERLVADQAREIARMQSVGGFADSKTLGIRCRRIEERLELVELDGEMIKDCQAHQVTMIEHHLRDRHDVDNIDRDDAPDVVPWRRIRHRMRLWAEKRGLMTKRRDVNDARRDEGRVRPRAAVSA